MAIFDGLRRRIDKRRQSKKSSASPMVGYFGVGTGEGKSYDYKDLANDGYLKNAIVYRCVNEISKGASAVNYMIKSGDVTLENHPLIDLIDRPNPLQSNSEFFNALFGFLLLGGNAYILKVGNGQQPRELHLLRPDRVEIKAGKNAIPDRYEYMINGRVQDTYFVDQETGFSDLKHIKLWNPLDDYYGCSPLSAAAVEVDQHNLASTHNINLLENGARPSGAVIFKPKDDGGFAVNLSESQRQQLLTDLNNRFTGTGNAGRPMLLEGDFDWREMGMSPKDMDFLNMKHMSATDIALCFGVPSQLVGVPDSQTYSNIAEARLALYEETIIPHLKLIQSDLNEWLIPQFGEQLEFCYDTEGIPALAERKRKTYENVSSAVTAGIMTRNEAREIIGLNPINGGDDIYIGSNLFPLSGDPTSEPDDPVAEAEVESYEDIEDDEKAEIRKDVFTTEEEAQERADEIGCVGTHSHDEDGNIIYMPCETHEAYIEATGEDVKALSDIDFKPTVGMAAEAQRGLDWRKKFKRGGTAVGVARANQLTNRENLSVSTVRRMYSFFSRHEVDKQGQGFNRGDDGYPSAGRIAWALWGGDSGFSWSTKKRNEIERELEKQDQQYDSEQKELTGKARKALEKKVEDHNEDYGNTKTKRVTLGMLEKVYNRGVGAYRTNPASVRPTVSSPEQWAMARVNSFLRALASGRFRGGRHDTDVFPKGHPLSTKE